ncbi:Protein indeterminate-domain 1 [Vigna angularis]|nr:Protein indeterminate-domain 1 [Vigna angularis]
MVLTDSPLPEVAAAAATTPAQSNSVISSGVQTQNPELPESNPPQVIEEPQATTAISGSSGSNNNSSTNCSASNVGATNNSNSSSVFASLFASSTSSGTLQSQTPAFGNLIRSMGPPDHRADITAPSSAEAISLCLSTSNASPIFATGGQEHTNASPPQPAMSATALLQKAAQMGAAATNASLLRGLGILSSSSASTPSGQQNGLQWGQPQLESESVSVPAGLGLSLPCDGDSGLKELMTGTPSMFGPKHTTLDFLGLGMAAGGGLSALITSIGGGLDVAAAAAAGTFGGNGEFSGKDIARRSS